MKIFRQLLLRSIFIISFLICLLLILNKLNFFSIPENITYDHRMRVSAESVRPSEEIIVVLLDQSSIDWGNKEFGWGWPWKREVYGDIVRFFEMAKAGSVTFDVMFTEPSIYGPEDDKKFAQACKDYGRTVHAIYKNLGHFSGWQKEAPLPPISNGNEFGSDKILFPIPEISSSAKILGNITDSSSSEDDVIRSVNSYYQYGSYFIPSMGLAALYAAGKEMPIPTEEGCYLKYQLALESYVPYSASQILQSYYAIQKGEEPLLEPELFEDTYVFFGFYAPGLFDICSTPVSSVFPGVGVHVTQLDNYLQNSFLKFIPNGFVVLIVFFMLVLGVVPISVAELYHSKHFNVFIATSCFVVFGAIYIFLSYKLFFLGYVLPIVLPITSLVLGFVVATVISYRQEGKQRRYLKSIFRQYLSPVIIEDLIAHPEKLVLGGERRRISIFFSDIENFTRISEGLDPMDLTKLLNVYLTSMTDTILEAGGTIDKYEGDAILSFWNAPVHQDCHSILALEAAIRCQEKLVLIRPELKRISGFDVNMRIGINTGYAVVGNMGSTSRFDYTMTGDAVNLASRLEGLNKQFGTYCMCSEFTKEDATKNGCKLYFRELARAVVVGKTEAVTVYEPMTAEKYLSKKILLEKFNQGLQLFYLGDFIKAKEIFEEIQEEDSPAKKYVEKCLEYVKNPPVKPWTGEWVATTK